MRHPRRHRRFEPGQRLHHFRHPARRRRAGLATSPSTRRARCRRPRCTTPIRPSTASARSTIKLPNGAQIDVVANNVVSFRPDRGRPEAARPDAGAGADPDRPAGRDAVERAVRQDHGRQRRSPARRPASTSTLSNVLPGNTINLTYTDTATNTQHQITIVNVDRSDRAAAAERRQCQSDAVIGVNFSGGIASIVVAAQHRARQARICRSPPLRRRRRPRCCWSTTATAARQVNSASTTDDGLVADLGQSATAAVHRRRARSTPARSRHRARR